MGTITSSGVGSGIDIEGLVSKLVSAEGATKQTLLAQQEATTQARISAYGSLKSALAQIQTAAGTLKDANVFRSRSTTVGDDKVMTASAGPAAAPGTYNVEVVRLAQGAKLVSGVYATSAATVGTGSLTLTTGGKAFTVDLTAANGTLAGIRDAINGSTKNSGIAASIVTANDGARLVLTSTGTGVANSVTVTASGGDGGLNALVYDPGGGTTNLTQLQAAQDARVIVDGFTYDSSSNSVTGALDGVTLDLKTATATGVTIPVSVKIDNSGVKKTISAFVTSYNQALTSLRTLGAYDASTKQGGPLLGDPTLRGVISALRNEVGASAAALAGNRYTVLSDIGITTNLDGSLKFDDAKVATALNADPAAVQRLFSSDGGVAKRLDQTVANFTKASGLLDSRTTGLQSTIKDIGRRQEALNAQLISYEKRIRAQFTAMDVMIANLKQTGQNLLSQLGSISTGNN